MLALCAWMTLAAATARARMASGCPSTGEGTAMLVHGSPMHGEGTPCAPACDCCAHAPAALPATLPPVPGALALVVPHWRLPVVRAPRPARAPPLRPPQS
jgi:hypothetical protein